MRASKSGRANNKIRTPRAPRGSDRNCTTDGVYGNNYFMHAATCHVGNLVKIETVQGSLYEGVFKTFSEKFEVVLELAHKVDNADPQKLNPEEVVETLIFNSQDIVYMCAPNTEPNYALKGAFQIDANISKYNGEIIGEKELQPWEGPPICNGEECDLEANDNNQNGWNVHDMFLKNEQFGVQTTYDESLSDYTCQIHRKDTKDFREDEAKAARIAMEIERNPSSQARSALENGDNEEDLFAAVQRAPANDSDDKYVPPPMKRKSSQHHRTGAGGGGGSGSISSNSSIRANYPTNGNLSTTASTQSSFNIALNTTATVVTTATNAPSKVSYSSPNHNSLPAYTSSNLLPVIPPRSIVRQGSSNPLTTHNTYPPRDREPRINGQIMENHAKHHNRPPPLILRGSARGSQRSYNVPESPGRQQMSNSAAIPRYHHQTSQPYHQQQSAPNHPQQLRDNTSRSSPESKSNAQICANTNQPQNIPTYSSNVHHQQRSFPPNAVSVPNHSQNVSSTQSSKSQRTSPVLVSALSNGNTDYLTKQLPSTAQPPPHQYQGSNQQSLNNANSNNNQRKQHHHQPQQHHHVIGKGGREELNNDLKKFSADFNLSSSYDSKSREHEIPKQIQVVTSRNKSPPLAQTPIERNVVTVPLVATLPQQNKYSTASASGSSTSVIASGSTASHAHPQQQQQPQQPPPPPPTAVTQSPVTGQPTLVAQSTLKHPSVLSQQPPPPFQPAQHPPMNLQARGSEQQPVLIQHQPHLAQQQPSSNMTSHHSQPVLQTKSQSLKTVPHQMSMHHHTVPPILAPVTGQPQSGVSLSSHPNAPPSASQLKPVINSSTTMPAAPQLTPSISPQAVTPQQANMLPPNVHQRPPIQQQPAQQKSLTSQSSQSTVQSPTPTEVASSDSESSVIKVKDEDDSVDDVASALKKSTLNPEAKEFVYNPTPKSFTPVTRSPSTPTQSRPHTPQTPSNYNIHAANAPVATGIQMVMPTYVVAASPGYVPPPPAASRIRKVPVNSHRTPEFHPSNIPVSAVTGQPLLAPSVTLAPSPLGHGTSFPVPAYPHHPQLTAQHYPHVQMIRMVQPGGMVPLVPSTISYHDSAGSNATAVYVNHQSGAVAMTPHTPHVHHPQQHPPPSTAPSPSQTPQGPSQSHTPNSYQHPPLATQSAPPYQSIMCPVIQAPPSHAPPHHMVAAQAQPHAMQQYLQHQQVAPQPHIQVSLIPHSCS